MEQSPRLSLSYLAPSQAQKHVTVNETFRRLDQLVQLTVLSRTVSAEPSSPADGDAYILPSGAGGAAWDGFSENDVAAFQDGAWTAIAPGEGFRAWVADENILAVHDGGGWAALSAGGASETAAMFGVNATADATNRLSVKADAALFSHDDVTPGSGDARIKVNKAAAGGTASHLFQTGFSGRAEFGLAGDDHFHVKVSADGAAWRDALIIDKDTGFAGVGVAPGDYALQVFRNDNKTGYANLANIVCGNNADGTNYSRSLFGQVSTNILFIDVANQANTKGALRLQPYGGIVGMGNNGAHFTVYGTSGGCTVGAPTGGDKGYGSLNAQAVYDDNALLSCYVFDQAIDGAVDQQKWDAKVPDRTLPETRDEEDRVVAPEQRVTRNHDPLRKFAARIGGAYDPLTLDGYARHWKEKRHLTSMPNEAAFDPERGMAAGEWIQRLVETVEIQAVLIEQLNEAQKALAAQQQAASGG